MHLSSFILKCNNTNVTSYYALLTVYTIVYLVRIYLQSTLITSAYVHLRHGWASPVHAVYIDLIDCLDCITMYMPHMYNLC